MYRIEIHREAKKEIEKLPDDLKRRIVKILFHLRERPYPYKEYDFKKLKGLDNVFRIRIGSYRISCYIDDKQKVVIVLEVKRRGGAYKDIKKRVE